jgi:polar amino acid transport system permease protein
MQLHWAVSVSNSGTLYFGGTGQDSYGGADIYYLQWFTDDGCSLAAKGYPQLQQMLTLTAFQTGVLALSLNYGAYMTEIFRAGIQSISGGQREAAQSLGMNGWQIMRRVILPQAVRIIIPDMRPTPYGRIY